MLQGHPDGKSLVMRGHFFAEAEWTLSTCAMIITDSDAAAFIWKSVRAPPTLTATHTQLQVHLFLSVLASILMAGNSLCQGVSDF